MDYQLKTSNTVVENQQSMIKQLDIVHANFKNLFPDRDSTWAYRYYNIFCGTSPSIEFHQLFQELKTVIRQYVGHEKPLWVQSWVNYHTHDQVLDWHDHEWPFHGYIAIDPKNTTTEFENYSIENKAGQIYIGPGNRKHRVIVNEHYTTPRITLGFDVLDHYDQPWQQFSLLPI